MISAAQKTLLHIAKSQLQLDREQYEAILQAQAGVTSSNDLDNAGFDAVMVRFEELGFTNTSTKKASWKKRSHHFGPDEPVTQRQQLLIRDLYIQLGWNDLAQQKAFNQRQTRKPWPQTRRDANKVIEGLKAILKRAVAE
jgi:hypothetical protein